MKFYSTKSKDLTADFRTALLTGMPVDGGLFMPESIPTFTTEEIDNLKGKSFTDVAFQIAKKFIDGEIPDSDLREIINSAYDFPVELKKLDKDNLVLELFHGPTLAFKDFAARFMARCVSYFLSQKQENKTILVATSGDTGGAVGNGFLGLENVKVVILYPKGGVSHVQEQQLTTMGQNVRACEVEGVFDDCQRMVKEAFVDQELNESIDLMSANSINIGRVVPQSFYYAFVSLQIPDSVFSIPSGNFGNLTGGLFAKKMGFPIKKFIAANNANHPFFDFLETGKFKPVSSVHTLSNAMDIGHPNNYYRIFELYGGNLDLIRQDVFGAWFDDQKTSEVIKRCLMR
ncbi:MAG: threonine synthase, partial [Candidatus Peregrinibacteria bacterium]|nr:threonine synthase [Candidatus Peregrinibacteria bacterium]